MRRTQVYLHNDLRGACTRGKSRNARLFLNSSGRLYETFPRRSGGTAQAYSDQNLIFRPMVMIRPRLLVPMLPKAAFEKLLLMLAKRCRFVALINCAIVSTVTRSRTT